MNINHDFISYFQLIAIMDLINDTCYKIIDEQANPKVYKLGY